jgi:hypothetical protein
VSSDSIAPASSRSFLLSAFSRFLPAAPADPVPRTSPDPPVDPVASSPNAKTPSQAASDALDVVRAALEQVVAISPNLAAITPTASSHDNASSTGSEEAGADAMARSVKSKKKGVKREISHSEGDSSADEGASSGTEYEVKAILDMRMGPRVSLDGAISDLMRLIP